jgi:hypothetical protein
MELSEFRLWVKTMSTKDLVDLIDQLAAEFWDRGEPWVKEDLAEIADHLDQTLAERDRTRRANPEDV